MASFLPLTFTQMVGLQYARAQAVAGRTLDSRVGATLRSLFEGQAAVTTWVQVLLLQVRDRSRLVTSSGLDVDTFVGDFALGRLPAIGAAGTVTLGRLSATGSAVVPVGGSVGAATDLVADFTITADVGHPAYDATVNAGGGGYVLQQNTYTVDVPVHATTPGLSGNVGTGVITLQRSAMPGIDTVTNSLPLTGGEDAESDESIKARFPLYIASLSKATRIAIEAAISAVQQGLTFSVEENEDEQGAFRPGHFVVVVDDGTGTPPPALLARVYAAVDAVRALTVTFSVRPPVVLAANISLSISVGPGGSKPALVAAVQSALTAYVRGLSVGSPLPFSRISAIAYAVDPSITNVSGTSLNGSIADLVPSLLQVVKPSVIVVS